MPANRHLFSDRPVPEHIVVDSSFVFHALIEDGHGWHGPARQFAEVLQQNGTILIYSSLIFLEAPQCWRRLFNAKRLPVQPGPDILTERKRAFDRANGALTRFLGRFGRYEVGITKPLIKIANSLVAQHGFLSSHDALCVAIAQDFRIPDIAALDRDFQKVPDIDLWDGHLP
jgi:predicted nucleic acid-binding protein